MKNEIYGHFHPDERPFVDKAWEWVENAAVYHELKRTEFLDPRQAFIVESLANRNPDVALRLDGGYPDAERRRALIGPDYRDLDSEEMELRVLEAVPVDPGGLDHGDYMGALLGLGVKRGTIGDIHVLEDRCHAVVTREMADFLSIHLTGVGRSAATTSVLPIGMLRQAQARMETFEISVASLRLDGIASDVCRVSRSKILAPIKAGRVRVNWKAEENPAALLKAGDTVSVQGFGRFRVLEVGDLTKKGRYRVGIGKFV
ncbi:RNA-binding protein [Paenibacillus spiritus]|uniref:RNA-binding protein n=1 Tax=Paenibacillus spiritus TaxID=2496557 RepID=A0A5J5GH92_9BACL|nr:YlmH/Sll1252 family protein [Paenibacillus spiritus]KAA9007589.1 RNA-binding protein [Paenibacillus spiritus]